MRRQLGPTALCLLATVQVAESHALSPGQQTVLTAGERGLAYFQALNARKDVQTFQVEVFDYESWSPSGHAIANPERIAVPTAQAGPASPQPRRFMVMVDLGGRDERVVRVCTKSLPNGFGADRARTSVNTRVCSKLTVKRLK